MTGALLDEVSETLYARHTDDPAAAAAARQAYEARRGRVHQEDAELWEAWSAAFVEWYVVERVAPGDRLPLAATSYAALGDGDPRREVIRALVTSHRSLFEIVGLTPARVELVDLLGGATFVVTERRAMHGVDLGDVAELRLVGLGDQIYFGRTFIYHPKSARNAIVARAQGLLDGGASRRDVIDHIAHLRVQITRYRHMSAARVYEPGSRLA